MSERPPAHGPAPSIWPVTLATGIGLAVVGLLTSPIVLIAGLILSVLALVGWIEQAVDEAAA
ncbi:MAG TPA: hypothetical protein VGR87_14405 [Candidatus Limnocylindria bacterium]|nr:hypothetical protein [Candidatus Limnocylindria bacterium]